jgi:hypothetical protein
VKRRSGHATHTFWRCFQRSSETTGFGVSVESDDYSLVANSVLSEAILPSVNSQL